MLFDEARHGALYLGRRAICADLALPFGRYLTSTSCQHWVMSGSPAQAVRMSAPRCKADEIGGKADFGTRTSAFGVRAGSLAYPMECLFVAISGHSATRVRSPNSSEIGCTEIPLESVQISLGVLRISGQPQRGTENSLFPCTPLKFLPSLWHARLAQRFDERLNELRFQETQPLRHKAQRKARGVRKKLIECIPGFLHAPEFGERGR